MMDALKTYINKELVVWGENKKATKAEAVELANDYIRRIKEKSTPGTTWEIHMDILTKRIGRKYRVTILLRMKRK